MRFTSYEQDGPSRLTRDHVIPVIQVGLVMWVLSVLNTGIGASRRGADVITVLGTTLPPLIYWLAALPGVLWLGQRYPLRRGGIAKALAVHALAAGVISAAFSAMSMWLITEVFPPGTHGLLADASPVATRAVKFQIGLFAYAFLLAWGQVRESAIRLRERELTATRLQAELAQAQLHALKAQLQPHFLFNTLHAITVLVRRDPDAATRTVTQLSDLLRMILADADQQEMTLERELQLLRLYLEIEQTRFRERLQVRWEIAPGLERATVPTLLLQPLVENAIKHGVEARASGGRVLIAAARDDGRLLLRVTDDGPGMHGQAPSRPGVGIGLTSTRRRLEALYGTHQTFTLTTGATGTSALIVLPYRDLPPPVEPRDG